MYQLPENTALVLRTSDASGTSHGGFQWPALGPIHAPDWNPASAHGGGLWGLLWGHGDPSHLRYRATPGAVWQVIEVPAAAVVFKHGKVKFPTGTVVCASRSRRVAVAFLNRHNPQPVPRLHLPQRDVQPVKAYSALAVALAVVVGIYLGALSLASVLLLAAVEALFAGFLSTYARHRAGSVSGPVTWLPAPPDLADEAETWLAGQHTQQPDTRDTRTEAGQ